MKITIFGATGRTGIEIVNAALANGHEVTAFVRNPDKLSSLKGEITIVKGDILSPNDVLAAVKGRDAVVSAIGPTKDSKEGFQPSATAVIVGAMKQANVRRLVTMTGAGVRTDGDRPRFIDKAIVLVMNLVFKKILRDGYGHAQVVKNSGLDWTIVRAPMLKNGLSKNTFTTGMVGDRHLEPHINRSDVALFIVSILAKREYFETMPVVADAK